MGKRTRSDNTRVLPVLKMRVGVAVDGAGFRELTGASLVDHTAGSRSVNQVPTFRGPGAVTGAKTVENVTFDLAAVQPHLAVMDDLDRADRNQLNVRVRMDIYSRNILAYNATSGPAVTATVPTTADAIAKGGPLSAIAADLLTLFNNNEIQVGDIIQTGPDPASQSAMVAANYFVVNRIEEGDGEGSDVDGELSPQGMYISLP